MRDESDMKRILTQNLQIALVKAIRLAELEETECCGKNFKSGIRAGWEEILQAIDRGEQITVSDE